jgi:hypothetical protein
VKRRARFGCRDSKKGHFEREKGQKHLKNGQKTRLFFTNKQLEKTFKLFICFNLHRFQGARKPIPGL